MGFPASTILSDHPDSGVDSVSVGVGGIVSSEPPPTRNSCTDVSLGHGVCDVPFRLEAGSHHRQDALVSSSAI